MLKLREKHAQFNQINRFPMQNMLVFYQGQGRSTTSLSPSLSKLFPNYVHQVRDQMRNISKRPMRQDKTQVRITNSISKRIKDQTQLASKQHIPKNQVRNYYHTLLLLIFRGAFKITNL